MQAGTAAKGRRTRLGECDREAPQAPAEVAVNERGVPAWLVTDEAGARLYATGATGDVVELDAGAVGEIRDSRAEGTRVAWTHAGARRDAELP